MKYHRKLLAVLGLFIVASSAQAGDGNVNYNGNACSAMFPQDQQYMRNIYKGIWNQSGVYHWVSCPISLEHTYDLGDMGVDVYYSGSQKVTCVLRNITYNGNIYWSDSGYRYGTGWVPTLSGPDKPDNDGVGETWSTYSLHCRVPAYGKITGYDVYEGGTEYGP